MRTLVQGGLVVRHDGVRRADVLLEDERIVEVGEGLSASGACVVDATDCYVLPGGVDAQVRPAGAGLGGLARAALLGGTTSLGVLPPCDGSTPACPWMWSCTPMPPENCRMRRPARPFPRRC